MIDLKALRENQELYARGFAKKQVDADIPAVLKLDEEYREVLQKVEEFRAEKNTVSKQIPTLPPDQRQSKIAEMKTLDGELNGAEEELNKLFVQLKALADQLPNPPHDSVPEGKDENDNEVVRTVGDRPVFSFKPKDHLELGTLLDLIDTETAAKVSGARFYYLKNEAVRLEFALIQWLLQKYTDKGFTPVTVPMLVKEEMMYATGFFPAGGRQLR